MHAQLRLRTINGMNSIMSNAGLTVLNLYFIKMGWTVLSAKKAPFLNLIKLDPLLVPPSTNMRRGAY